MKKLLDFYKKPNQQLLKLVRTYIVTEEIMKIARSHEEKLHKNPSIKVPQFLANHDLMRRLNKTKLLKFM